MFCLCYWEPARRHPAGSARGTRAEGWCAGALQALRSKAWDVACSPPVLLEGDRRPVIDRPGTQDPVSEEKEHAQSWRWLPPTVCFTPLSLVQRETPKARLACGSFPPCLSTQTPEKLPVCASMDLRPLCFAVRPWWPLDCYHVANGCCQQLLLCVPHCAGFGEDLDAIWGTFRLYRSNWT